MEDLRITLVQSGLHWQSIDANLAMFEEKLWNFSPAGGILVLPEMFNTGFSMQARELAETMNGKTHRWMKRMSEQFGVVITGSLIIKEKTNYFNRLIWTDPEGKTFYYDKRHLFRMSGEQKRFSSGNSLISLDFKGWKIRPFICYDLRFPVWTRNKMDDTREDFSYDIILFVANWPASRIQAWETLLKARAIENSSFCIGVNRTGSDGEGTLYNGHSLVLDYKGKTLFEAGEKEQIDTVILHWKDLQEYRQKFPVHYDGDDYNIVY